MGLASVHEKRIIMGAAGVTVNLGGDGFVTLEKVAWCRWGG